MRYGPSKENRKHDRHRLDTELDLRTKLLTTITLKLRIITFKTGQLKTQKINHNIEKKHKNTRN